MSNKRVTIRRPVQHLIPLKMSRDWKNEISIELNNSKTEIVEETDHRNATNSDFEKRKFRETAAANTDLIRRLNEDD